MPSPPSPSADPAAHPAYPHFIRLANEAPTGFARSAVERDRLAWLLTSHALPHIYSARFEDFIADGVVIELGLSASYMTKNGYSFKMMSRDASRDAYPDLYRRVTLGATFGLAVRYLDADGQSLGVATAALPRAPNLRWTGADPPGACVSRPSSLADHRVPEMDAMCEFLVAFSGAPPVRVCLDGTGMERLRHVIFELTLPALFGPEYAASRAAGGLVEIGIAKSELVDGVGDVMSAVTARDAYCDAYPVLHNRVVPGAAFAVVFSLCDDDGTCYSQGQVMLPNAPWTPDEARLWIHQWLDARGGGPSPPPPPAPTGCCRHCGGDGLATKLKLCSVCMSTRYCGGVCQRADWPRHKKEHV